MPARILQDEHDKFRAAAAGGIIGTRKDPVNNIDDALDIDLSGTTGLLIAAGGGVGGAVALLAVSWRPPDGPDTADS